jgi:hypothetical protein
MSPVLSLTLIFTFVKTSTIGSHQSPFANWEIARRIKHTVLGAIWDQSSNLNENWSTVIFPFASSVSLPPFRGNQQVVADLTRTIDDKIWITGDSLTALTSAGPAVVNESLVKEQNHRTNCCFQNWWYLWEDWWDCVAWDHGDCCTTYFRNLESKH